MAAAFQQSAITDLKDAGTHVFQLLWTTARNNTLYTEARMTRGCGELQSFKTTYLSLGDAEARGQLRALRQREVLGPLEPPLQLLDLQRGVNRTWLPDLLPLSIDSSDQLAVFYYTVSCNIQE